MTQTNNTATIYEIYKDDMVIVGYGVALNGECSEEYGIDTNEDFDTNVDAFAFAEECKLTTGSTIVWECNKPSWG